jgi:hypothetical protein
MISNELISSLWNGLTLELDHLAAPRCLPHGFLEATLCRFNEERLGLGEDVFPCIANPAGRAGKEVLSLSISGAFKGYATRAAKDALGIVSH